LVDELSEAEGLVLLAGRYEGVDERLIELEIDEEVSVGDYVVSGGELPAMLMIDSIVRRIPGVLNDDESAAQESFVDGILDCPHYTRPEVFDGLSVPPVLLSGNHADIRRWRLKQALGAVYNCTPPIDEITNNHLEALKLAEDFRQMKKTRRAAKGRISSIVRATASNLDFIIEAKKTMSRLPGVTPNSPTIVCAGFPNVGKSTLVKAVSTAEPEIAHYPFTTKKVIIGHLTIGDQSVQIIDTPGILDRPMSERNEIERQAIAALKYLAHVIIFMLDPSEACGWGLNDQLSLYREVQRTFPLNPLLVVLNKIDITPPEQLELARKKVPGAHEMIAIEGKGVQELMNDALEEVDLVSLQDSVDEFVAQVSQRESDPSDS